MSETSLLIKIDGSAASAGARVLDSDLDRLKKSGDSATGAFDRLTKELIESRNVTAGLDDRLKGLIFTEDKLHSAVQGNTSALAALNAQVQRQFESQRVLQASMDATIRSIREEADATRSLGAASGQATSSASLLTGSVRGLFGAFVAYGGLRIAGQIIETGVAFDSLDQKFKAVFGSSQRGRAEFAFVQKEAERLGLSVRVAADSYGSFAAASIGTTLEGAKTRDIFSAVAEAAGRLHISSDQTQGALLAIQQIMSKGTVQAEELRGQLGERLPGAFQIAARAMGVTTAELGNLLQSGSVASDVFLPKFAEELRRTFDTDANTRIESVASNFARLKNEIQETAAALGGLANRKLGPTAGAFAEELKFVREQPFAASVAIPRTLITSAIPGLASTLGIDDFTDIARRANNAKEYADKVAATIPNLGTFDPLAPAPRFFAPGQPTNIGRAPIDLTDYPDKPNAKLLAELDKKLAFTKLITNEERTQYEISSGRYKNEAKIVQERALEVARAEDQKRIAEKPLPAALTSTRASTIRADAEAAINKLRADEDLKQTIEKNAYARGERSYQQYYDNLASIENDAYASSAAARQRQQADLGAELARLQNLGSKAPQGAIDSIRTQQSKLNGQIEVDAIAHEKAMAQIDQGRVDAASTHNSLIASLQEQLYQNDGQSLEQALARAERNYQDTLKKIGADAEGEKLAKKIFDGDVAKAQLDDFGKKISSTLGFLDFTRAQQDALVSAGLEGPLTAYETVRKASLGASDELARDRDELLERLSQNPADPIAKKYLDDVNRALAEIKSTLIANDPLARVFGIRDASDLTNSLLTANNAALALGDTLGGAFSNAADSISGMTADLVVFGDAGNLSLKKIGQTLVRDVLQGLIKIELQLVKDTIARNLFNAASSGGTGGGVGSVLSFGASLLGGGVGVGSSAALGGFNVATGGGSIGATLGDLGGPVLVPGFANGGFIDGRTPFERLVHMSTGGPIDGPGTSTSDSIPALLSKGEFVVKASTVDRYGVDFFERINAQRFATGGYVGGSPGITELGGNKVNVTIGDTSIDARGADASMLPQIAQLVQGSIARAKSEIYEAIRRGYAPV